jgi:orotate phosphoribosyltransferase
MAPYKHSFLKMAFEASALKFGEFTLKSGRVSPYFFNASAFSTGQQLATLGRCYRDAILARGIAFDGLFGPAYKGIPLASSVAIAFSEIEHNLPVSFNRKEIKEHGEGGQLLGAPLSGQVVAIDDVVTAGTAVRESVEFVQDHGGHLRAFCVALDRQERGQDSTQSALGELATQFNLTPISIVTLDDVLAFAADDPRVDDAITSSIEAYRSTYGAVD